MIAEKQVSVHGARPEGARDEREAATRVQEMFGRIAPRYDFLNHFLSFSLDRVWRRRTAGRFLPILRQPGARILDLCCGTADLAFSLDRARAQAFPGLPGIRTPVIGADFAHPMLERANEKSRDASRRAVFVTADALSLPFADDSFDLVTTAFGFRNLANYENGLREIARVLKPGGEVGILEFSEPSKGPMAGIFRFYFRHILPRLGGAISGSGDAYAYLPCSVARFPSPAELAALMQRRGFSDVVFVSWNFGSVILHSGKRTPITASEADSPLRSGP